MQQTFRKLIIALALWSLLIAVPLAMAEEAAGAESQAAQAATAPPGAATLMLLLGAGAILIVGLTIMARDNFRGDSSG